MMRQIASLAGSLFVIAAVAAGAWWASGQAGGVPVLSAPPSPLVTPAPPYQTTQAAAERYIKAWEEGRYADMHALFTPEAQATTPGDKFVQRMHDIRNEAKIARVTGSVGDYYAWPTADDQRGVNHQQVKVALTVTSTAVGEFNEELTLNTIKDESGAWRIAWTPDALFRGLAGERLVHLFTDRPVRGAIVDRSGTPLATEGSVITVGVVRAWLQNEDAAVAQLAQYLDLKPDAIRLEMGKSQPDWYVPLKELPGARKGEALAKFAASAGVVVREKGARGYPGALAPHVTGYVSPVTADDLLTLAAKGYGEEDKVGRAGIERWGEEYLAGKAGNRLAIITRDGQPVRTIVEQGQQHGSSIELALDAKVQRIAEEALGARVGSVVILDPRDNAVLALASGPRFDPNGFVRGWTGAEWQHLNNDPLRPFQHRPALSAYAAGSVFKVITMSAGLERGGFTPTSRFNCNGRWTGLPGTVFGDWLPNGHGALDLSGGLTQSCDLVFYEVAKKLDGLDAGLLPEFARGFGLGAPTGVAGIAEAAGTVPDPDWKRKALNQGWFSGDTINLGIGQGYLEATPLQIANAYAAIARGGSMKTPLLVRRVLDSRGNAVKEFAAEDKGALPVSAENLTAVKDAMKRVIGSPEGTTYAAFKGYKVPVAGKTGAAENQDPEKTHAWFVGFAPADNPTVLVTVMLERGGFGGVDAAPVARRIFEQLLP